MMLYIVRHGETDWNRQKKVQGHTDIPLNEYGRHLAEETAEGMKDIPIDIGYTSPLKRARETAEIILKGRNIPLLDEPRIQEIGFGIYEGIHTGTQEKEPGSDEFNLFFTDTASYIPPEGAESVEELYERTGQFLEELCGRRELEDKNILISTHGAAMTALLNRIKGNVTVAGFWKDEVPPNCSVTMVEVRDGQAAIVKEGVIYYREKVKKWKTV
ncbi:histidine phosphatase family protein [Mediterraneibacter glycyrrhizinilyticus]|uniref:histidine phosphatase family protein n=1 Tax=Mediterraneibacter glycyrrhizinilyticus TaxID=342942 RepID=UPI00195FF4B7|nr:histidine phosphatase family protein [Mediterraneibacter glycyrrhizinilyticus]MBM6751179.1 histidine phosphatase family protein [Mediterraneibacter glycyrrhizinilyticus]